MNMQSYRPILFAFAAIILAANLVNCSKLKRAEVKPPKSETLVLRYSDFGPQIMSYELLGMDWYQWNSQGPDDPNERDDIKVVVYRNIPLDEVERSYPVIERKQDYRYLEYGAALNLLNKYEVDPFWEDYPETQGRARQTKEKILEQLGT